MMFFRDEYYENHQETRNDGLIIVGWSKGAELS
jgi:hypothetical protein